MNTCHECGDPYDPRDETRADGRPLNLCVPCAEDFLHPAADFNFWED
jgi:formylmethanofuran dehydrogenase subunit E